MKEFVTAAKDQLGEVDEDSVEVFKHNGNEVRFFEPSDGQQAIMLSMGGRSMTKKSAGTFIQLFIELGDDDTQRYFHDLLLDRNSGFDLMSEGGIFDIWEYLMEQWSGKATKQPSDFQPSRRATGPRSTGTTRAKASTSSGSRGRASST